MNYLEILTTNSREILRCIKKKEISTLSLEKFVIAPNSTVQGQNGAQSIEKE